jgi:hypothetical protein
MQQRLRGRVHAAADSGEEQRGAALRRLRTIASACALADFCDLKVEQLDGIYRLRSFAYHDSWLTLSEHLPRRKHLNRIALS